MIGSVMAVNATNQPPDGHRRDRPNGLGVMIGTSARSAMIRQFVPLAIDRPEKGPADWRISRVPGLR